MLKVKRIVAIDQYSLICEFDTGIQRKLNVLPLIEKHLHMEGVASLKNKVLFDTVAVGELGEIYWENIVKTAGGIWNYDISPEYVFYNGSEVS